MPASPFPAGEDTLALPLPSGCVLWPGSPLCPSSWNGAWCSLLERMRNQSICEGANELPSHPSGSLLSVCHQPTPASWAAVGGFAGGPEESGAGRLAEQGPGPSHLLGLGRPGGSHSQHGPSSQALRSFSWRNLRTPVQSRERGYFWHLWGEGNASLLLRDIWGLRRADGSCEAQSPRRWGSRPAATGLPPSAAQAPTCPPRALAVPRPPVPRPSLGPSRAASPLKLRAAVTAEDRSPVQRGKEARPAVDGGQEAPVSNAHPSLPDSARVGGTPVSCQAHRR